MAYTTIDDPTLYFNTVLYTGNATARSITGVGFQPDWTWIKGRSFTYNHGLYDTVRGATKRIVSNNSNAEDTRSDALTAFGTDGFSLGSSDNQVNANSATYASWNWKAGTSFTNDASATGVGSLDSAGSINTTAGFSIIGYSGDTSDAPSTVAHGLSQKPEIMFIKRRTSTGQWVVYNETIDATDNLHLDSTAARHDYLYFFQDTEPTSSVFTVGDDGESNKTGDTYINYIFHSVKGYSKIGSYTGNGSAGTSSPFVYLGFKPAWVMIKNTADTHGWSITDNKRNGYNENSVFLYANESNADAAYPMTSFYSNGFQPIEAGADKGATNDSGVKYIYMAFAESPFVNSKGVPNNAR